jgi:hypothetical protein
VDGLTALCVEDETDWGWVVGVGDTPIAAVEHLKSIADALAGLPCAVDTGAVIDVLAAVHKEEEAGIEVTAQEVPEPAAALDT